MREAVVAKAQLCDYGRIAARMVDCWRRLVCRRSNPAARVVAAAARALRELLIRRRDNFGMPIGALTAVCARSFSWKCWGEVAVGVSPSSSAIRATRFAHGGGFSREGLRPSSPKYYGEQRRARC
eukprot:13776085-Alexandrium_andersonii.AAC.1